MVLVTKKVLQVDFVVNLVTKKKQLESAVFEKRESPNDKWCTDNYEQKQKWFQFLVS